MGLTKSESEDIREMLIDIQLALSSTHNTVTTDDVDAQPDEMHWRINHTEYLEKTNKIASLLGISLCNSPRYTNGENQEIEWGIIPAGTEIRFGHYCATTLEHDLKVNLSQEKINKKIIEKTARDKRQEHLLVSSDIKKELELRDLSQQERNILNQAFVYEPSTEVIENIKRELELPDLQQEVRDALNNVAGCLTDTQTLASLWLKDLREWLQSHSMED